MRLVSILDFDGTIVYEDVFERLLDEFTKEDWRYYDYLVERGELSLEEAVNRQFQLISYAGIDRLLEASKKYLKMRSGFLDFADFCYENNIDLVIASAGLDFYIYYLLNSHDIKAICHCMHVLEEDGKLKLIAPDFDRSKFRNFKQAIVKEYINKGYSPIYIGDGFNDFWAAKEAWLVFAVENSVLEKKCADARLRFKSFKHFSEIKQLLLEILS